MTIISNNKLLSINSRKIHRTIGLILLLPMLGWTITGMIFFIKPGYKQAYEQLALKTYPLEMHLTISPEKKWQEARLIKTILGHHLLIKKEGKTEHLDPTTFQTKKTPSSSQTKKLIEDALASNIERYGEIISVSDNYAQTSTGIELKLDWLNLKLKQTGDDTKLINLLYKIHYLQWTPFKGANQVLGILGLILLITLTLFGLKLYIRNKG